jgi:riboflavin kinase/FMN adenylyltransferase
VEIYHDISELGKIKNAVVTVGTFDGVHRGHQKLISETCRRAIIAGGESVVITFDPHPRLVLQPSAGIKLINTLDEKIEVFSNMCVKHLLIIPFTTEFALTSSEDFLKKYIVDPFDLKAIVIGYDHHFGKDRQGNLDFLEAMGSRYGFEVDQIPVQAFKDVPLSSSKVREAIQKGQMPEARERLGYHYSLSGIVVKGNQVGRTLGFPTANIELDNPDKLIPAYGVYAVLIKCRGKMYGGMSNIGIRPTLDDHELTIEVNIFDFNEDIYGETITIYFIKHTREEKKFRDLELLRRRLIIDKVKVEKILEQERVPG